MLAEFLIGFGIAAATGMAAVLSSDVKNIWRGMAAAALGGVVAGLDRIDALQPGMSDGSAGWLWGIVAIALILAIGGVGRKLVARAAKREQCPLCHQWYTGTHECDN